jgi:hypothetical protein
VCGVFKAGAYGIVGSASDRIGARGGEGLRDRDLSLVDLR